MTERDLYRRAIGLAGIVAVAAPPTLAGAAFLASSLFGSIFPWVTAKLMVGAIASSIFFGLPAFAASHAFLFIARNWSAYIHFWALVLSPVLVAALLSAVLLAILASPPNDLPTIAELPPILSRFSLLVLVPGYLFVSGVLGIRHRLRLAARLTRPSA